MLASYCVLVRVVEIDAVISYSALKARQYRVNSIIGYSD